MFCIQLIKENTMKVTTTEAIIDWHVSNKLMFRKIWKNNNLTFTVQQNPEFTGYVRPRAAIKQKYVIHFTDSDSFHAAAKALLMELCEFYSTNVICDIESVIRMAHERKFHERAKSSF